MQRLRIAERLPGMRKGLCSRSSRKKRNSRVQSVCKVFAYAALGALLVYLSGCAAPQPHLMATPVVFKDGRLDFIPHLPPPLRTTRLPVFYATTRAPVRGADVLSYSNSPG